MSLPSAVWTLVPTSLPLSTVPLSGDHAGRCASSTRFVVVASPDGRVVVASPDGREVGALPDGRVWAEAPAARPSVSTHAVSTMAGFFTAESPLSLTTAAKGMPPTVLFSWGHVRAPRLRPRADHPRGRRPRRTGARAAGLPDHLRRRRQPARTRTAQRTA